MRFDDLEGKPIAILVNFAAHPVMTDEKILKYSADYPGFLKNKVEAELATKCVFMQGASGDMSPNVGSGPPGPEGLRRNPGRPRHRAGTVGQDRGPRAAEREGHRRHVPLQDPRRLERPASSPAVFERSFFPEITHAYQKLYGDSLAAELNTVLLNGEIALVGGSGEFFCNHANRLKARAYVKHTLFFGYCNGHGMYFPTIEATSEGGYGADPGVSFAEIGAGERMMDQALFNIYKLLGKFARERKVGALQAAETNR